MTEAAESDRNRRYRFVARVVEPIIGLDGAAGTGLGLGVAEGSPGWGFAGVVKFDAAMATVGLVVIVTTGAWRQILDGRADSS